MISLLKLTNLVISSFNLLSNVPHLVINFELVESVDVIDRLPTQLVALLC